MIVVPETAVTELVTPEDALAAVEAVFAAMADGTARNFPVVREALSHADAVYGLKSGFDRDGGMLGVKAGGYWPGNAAHGLTNHQSTVCLFDPDSGQCRALVAGNRLTALRTAAAAAVSIRHLASPEAEVLGIVGAGHQAAFQLRAALGQCAFRRVLGWNRHPERLAELETIVGEGGLPFESVPLARLGREADVIITITSSGEPLVLAEHVVGPTHIAAMGTDTRGKQELDSALVAQAACFTDEPAQAASIGECQHAVAAGRLETATITPIGEVIRGRQRGRDADATLTLFDGTGVGLQDLAVAALALRRAETGGQAQEVAL